MLEVYRPPRRRPPLDAVDLQALIDDRRREHARRSPEEATSITAAAVSRWMVNPRSLRVLSVTKARQA
jgi:hypothetical protein